MTVCTSINVIMFQLTKITLGVANTDLSDVVEK